MHKRRYLAGALLLLLGAGGVVFGKQLLDLPPTQIAVADPGQIDAPVDPVIPPQTSQPNAESVAVAVPEAAPIIQPGEELAEAEKVFDEPAPEQGGRELVGSVDAAQSDTTATGGEIPAALKSSVSDNAIQTAERAPHEPAPERQVLTEPVSTDEPSVRSAPQTDAARDRQLAAVLERLLAEGKEAEANQALANAVAEGRSMPRSHTAMAAYYLAQRRMAEARRWLDPELAVAHLPLRLLQGRLILLEEGAEIALRYLEPGAPTPAEAPDYHATLASLYQQSGRYDAAGDRWGALLEVDSRRADYWLGLALALDAQNQLAGARLAYSEALALPNLAPRLKHYAETRIRELR